MFVKRGLALKAESLLLLGFCQRFLKEQSFLCQTQLCSHLQEMSIPWHSDSDWRLISMSVFSAHILLTTATFYIKAHDRIVIRVRNVLFYNAFMLSEWKKKNHPWNTFICTKAKAVKWSCFTRVCLHRGSRLWRQIVETVCIMAARSVSSPPCSQGCPGIYTVRVHP